jgi:hypothetical protein
MALDSSNDFIAPKYLKGFAPAFLEILDRIPRSLDEFRMEKRQTKFLLEPSIRL